MFVLPADWSALFGVLFILGMRHGLDPDHLAAIDGLTRLAAHDQRGAARCCGVLVSLGHGCVVMAIATTVGLLSERWTPPSWLDRVGAWVSIGVLLALGIVKLREVLRTAPGRVVALVGIKGTWLARWLPLRGSLGAAAVGALFALSIDTVSQAALFGVTAAPFGGRSRTFVLGLVFVQGMLLSDGLNGWWVSHLIERTGPVTARAFRILSLVLSCLSLLIAALGLGRLVNPAVADRSAGKDLVFGELVVLAIAVDYVIARWGARSASAPREHT